jgi:hypothetical protein
MRPRGLGNFAKQSQFRNRWRSEETADAEWPGHCLIPLSSTPLAFAFALSSPFGPLGHGIACSGKRIPTGAAAWSSAGAAPRRPAAAALVFYAGPAGARGVAWRFTERTQFGSWGNSVEFAGEQFAAVMIRQEGSDFFVIREIANGAVVRSEDFETNHSLGLETPEFGDGAAQDIVVLSPSTVDGSLEADTRIVFHGIECKGCGEAGFDQRAAAQTPGGVPRGARSR